MYFQGGLALIHYFVVHSSVWVTVSSFLPLLVILGKHLLICCAEQNQFLPSSLLLGLLMKFRLSHSCEWNSLPFSSVYSIPVRIVCNALLCLSWNISSSILIDGFVGKKAILVDSNLYSELEIYPMFNLRAHLILWCCSLCFCVSISPIALSIVSLLFLFIWFFWGGGRNSFV